jgi:hypothetical protein
VETTDAQAVATAVAEVVWRCGEDAAALLAAVAAEAAAGPVTSRQRQRLHHLLRELLARRRGALPRRAPGGLRRGPGVHRERDGDDVGRRDRADRLLHRRAHGR